jgi:hypothetical protein
MHFKQNSYSCTVVNEKNRRLLIAERIFVTAFFLGSVHRHITQSSVVCGPNTSAVLTAWSTNCRVNGILRHFSEEKVLCRRGKLSTAPLHLPSKANRRSLLAHDGRRVDMQIKKSYS